MSMNREWQVTVRGLMVRLIALVVLAACGAPPLAPLPERPAAPSADLLFDAGVDYAVDDLLTQVRRLPRFNAPPKSGMDKAFSDLQKKEEPPPPPGAMAVEPATDSTTGP